MLEQVLQECNNWFVRDIQSGVFTVADGRLALPHLQEGQYFRIVGSIFNDGVYQYPYYRLTEETFHGAVWALAIPKAVLDLSEKVAQWEEKNGGASPFTSESFGGYSYSKAVSKNGAPMTWADAFAAELRKWRKK